MRALILLFLSCRYYGQQLMFQQMHDLQMSPQMHHTHHYQQPPTYPGLQHPYVAFGPDRGGRNRHAFEQRMMPRLDPGNGNSGHGGRGGRGRRGGRGGNSPRGKGRGRGANRNNLGQHQKEIVRQHKITKTSMQNTINLDFVRNGMEERTTVMIRNIPNRYSRESLVEVFQDFVGTFDFFYLPIDAVAQANIGYAFINFVTVSGQRCCGHGAVCLTLAASTDAVCIPFFFFFHGCNFVYSRPI